MTDLGRFFALLDGLPPSADAEFLYDPSTEAGGLRRANLERYLALVAAQTPTTALIAEAPGYRGATATGVPFMSVRELTARPGLVTGWDEGDGFQVPPAPAWSRELSAGLVWRAVAEWWPRPVCWPVYPSHPHRPGDTATNRAPRPAEVRAGAPIALALLDALGVQRVIAVGRKAEGALAAAGIAATPVRHPAQGGATLFATQLATLGPLGRDRRARMGR